MTIAAGPLQAAVFALLASAEPPLAAGGIHDQVPDEVCFPHVQIGSWQILPDSTTTAAGGGSDAGTESFVDVHVWSRYAGNLEALQILDRIHGLADGASLTVAGRASAHVWVDGIRGPMQDSDGRSRHGILTLKIISRS